MDTLSTLPAVFPTSSPASTPVYHFNKLELAPQGWLPLVEKLAKGYTETIGEHEYCQECDGLIDGSTGHRFDCPTMIARRLLTNLPFLLSRHTAAMAALAAASVGVDDMPAARVTPTAPDVRTGTDG